MKYDETGVRGPFSLRGAGFYYRYHTHENRIDIMDDERSVFFARCTLGQHPLNDVQGYLHHLDKATQIRALVYSNNKTNNLLKTLDARKIEPIMTSTARSSYHAHKLHNSHFCDFCKSFANDMGIKSLRIKKFVSNDRLNEFFVGRIQTQNHNSVSVRACTLPQLMKTLSESTKRELVTAEYGCKESAGQLLRVSSKLAYLGRILDDDFSPENALEFDENDQKRETC